MDRRSIAPALAVAIPAIVILAALPFLQVGDGTSVPELALFLGRFHPTVLHLPIALLLLALLLELIRLPALRRLQQAGRAATCRPTLTNCRPVRREAENRRD